MRIWSCTQVSDKLAPFFGTVESVCIHLFIHDWVWIHSLNHVHSLSKQWTSGINCKLPTCGKTKTSQRMTSASSSISKNSKTTTTTTGKSHEIFIWMIFSGSFVFSCLDFLYEFVLYCIHSLVLFLFCFVLHT